jgi:hypothetical protein
VNIENMSPNPKSHVLCDDGHDVLQILLMGSEQTTTLAGYTFEQGFQTQVYRTCSLPSTASRLAQIHMRLGVSAKLYEKTFPA